MYSRRHHLRGFREHRFGVFDHRYAGIGVNQNGRRRIRFPDRLHDLDHLLESHAAIGTDDIGPRFLDGTHHLFR